LLYGGLHLTHCCWTSHRHLTHGAWARRGLTLPYGLGGFLVLDHFSQSVDKGCLVVGDEAEVRSFFSGVQQNQDFDVAGTWRWKTREVHTASLKHIPIVSQNFRKNNNILLRIIILFSVSLVSLISKVINRFKAQDLKPTSNIRSDSS